MLMTFAHFNTLDYVKLLLQAKFTEQQAEALNEAQSMAIRAVITQVATPADLQNLRLATQTDLQKLNFEMQAEFQVVYSEFKAVRSEMQAEFQAVRSEMQAEFQVVHSEFKAVRSEMRELKAELLQKIKDSESRLQKEINKSIQYSTGINIALIGLVIGLMTLDL